MYVVGVYCFFQAEDGIRYLVRSRGLGDVYKRQLIANVPAVLVGEALAQKLPMKAIRYTAAGVFIATGLVTMFGMPGIAQ